MTVDAIRLTRPAPPDADFDALRAGALATVQETQRDATRWSDHNLHDPGITLLEAALWALADLHYRIEERSFDGWPFELAAWRGGAPVRGADREAVAEFFALPANVDVARAGLARAASRARAALELAGATTLKKPDGTQLRLSRAAAEAVVVRLREPLLEQALLDRTGVLRTAIAGASSPTAARSAVTRLVEDLALWPEELDALFAAVARRRVVRLLRERADELRAYVAGAPDATTALAGLAGPYAEEDGPLELTVDQAALALGEYPCPPVAPELWESADGATALWPPHPLQARTCEPVTDGDYRRLVLTAPHVNRAWVVRGQGRGVGWDGSTSSTPDPLRQGALTLVIEPDPVWKAPKRYNAAITGADVTFLTDCLDYALEGPTGQSDVKRPYALHGATYDEASPRRLLGDELGAALLGTFGVVVHGILEIFPTASETFVLQQANDLLAGFLSPQRISPLEPVPPAPAPMVCPRDLDGPWPLPAAVPELLADPEGSAAARGWRPGDPVRASEIVQLLHEIPGVAGVVELEVQEDGAAPTVWYQELTAPGAYADFSVPVFVRHCLCTRLVEPRECRNA